LSPKVPDAPGLVLSCSPSFSIKEKKPIVLYGSYMADVPSCKGSKKSDGQSSSIILPVFLLVSGTRQRIVGSLDLNIPVGEIVSEKSNRQTVQGYFALDLRRYFRFEENPQQYSVTVFSREMMARSGFELKE